MALLALQKAKTNRIKVTLIISLSMSQKNQGRHVDLELDSYDYELPPGLIAERPSERREAARLLVYDQQTGNVTHDTFENITQHLPKHTEMFFNQSKVFPCRLNARKKSGGKVEVFVLSLLPDQRGAVAALLKSSGKKRPGDQLDLPGGVEAHILERTEDALFYVQINCTDLHAYLEQYAGVPIPPYIRGGVDDERDREDYQTSFASESGSVAAPTAGLHFTPALLQKLKDQGIKTNFLTLHVGMGTFAPVKAQHILDHKMHSESYRLDSSILKAMRSESYKLAVGTTSLRALESVRRDPEWPLVQVDQMRSTDIFLYPGVEVHSIDALITNFHLPKSTLLMLVSSLIGREKTLELYREAIEKQYRFYSYGDGMLIKRKRS